MSRPGSTGRESPPAAGYRVTSAWIGAAEGKLRKGNVRHWRGQLDDSNVIIVVTTAVSSIDGEAADPNPPALACGGGGQRLCADEDDHLRWGRKKVNAVRSRDHSPVVEQRPGTKLGTIIG